MADSLNTTISRRAILTGIPAAAIGVGTLAAPAMAFEPDTDADLVALDAEFGREYRTWLPLRLAATETDEDNGCDNLLECWGSITGRMASLPATTMRGFAAKATLVLSEALDLDQKAALWSGIERDLDWQVLILWRFVNEMRAAAGLGPSPMRNA